MFVIDLEKLKAMEWEDIMAGLQPFESAPGPQECTAEVCCYDGHRGYRCGGEDCVELTWRTEKLPESEYESALPVVGTLSLGPVRLDCPYINYGNLTAKLPAQLRFLTLTQGEELVDFLAGLESCCPHEGCGTLGSRDFLHEEMALAALCRDNPAMCERQKAKLSDPASFVYDDDAEVDEFMRELFGED